MKHSTSLHLFNLDRHRDVRVIPGPDIISSRRLNHAQIGLSETGIAASDYPLLFMKDIESGRFRLVALFGLKTDTSFFVVDDQWQATYLPLALLSAPFYLGGPERSLCIDESSDLVTTDTGAALFSDDGSETGELLRVRAMLEYLREDIDAATFFTSKLVDLGLIQPLSVTLEFDRKDDELVDGLYSISPHKLLSLADSAILDLHRQNFLDKIHIIINSLSQINRIQQLSNLHLDQAITKLTTQMYCE